MTLGPDDGALVKEDGPPELPTDGATEEAADGTPDDGPEELGTLTADGATEEIGDGTLDGTADDDASDGAALLGTDGLALLLDGAWLAAPDEAASEPEEGAADEAAEELGAGPQHKRPIIKSGRPKYDPTSTAR